ncbi:MAG TPA: DUF1080 domain-containing protein [Sphingobacterium sp.]|nr:DUF1080 domain-containing protein [Sphingobacterium sp.]
MEYFIRRFLGTLILLCCGVFIASSATRFFQGQPDTTLLSTKEVKKGWELLFDGHDPSKHWKELAGSGFPSSGWTIENKELVLLPKEKGVKNIISIDTFSNFELVLDFMLTKNANTGIKYFVAPLVTDKGKVELNGPEYQLIDDHHHPSVANNKSPETSTGSVYLLYAPHKSKILKPFGEWNQARIVAKGKRVEHWLNGKKILSYRRGSKDFRKRVADTKFKMYKSGYGESLYGHILLQDHNDGARFRNIKIRKLK